MPIINCASVHVLASFRNQSAAKRAVENGGQISHFLAHVKFRGRHGWNVWVTSSACNQSSDVRDDAWSSKRV